MLKFLKKTIQSFSSQYQDNIEECDFQCKSGIDESLFFMLRGITISYSTYEKKGRNNLVQDRYSEESHDAVDIYSLDEKKCFRKS